MFNQRKSFLKGKLFYIILLALFGFGLWLNQAPVGDRSSEDINANTKNTASSDDSAKQGDSESYDIMENIIGKGQTVTPDSASSSETDPASAPGELEKKGYYLVKEVNGVIMIFYYDQEGKESVVRETDIAFSLLSITDQALFHKGVIKHTPEELDELLQDFES